MSAPGATPMARAHSNPNPTSHAHGGSSTAASRMLKWQPPYLGPSPQSAAQLSAARPTPLSLSQADRSSACAPPPPQPAPKLLSVEILDRITSLSRSFDSWKSTVDKRLTDITRDQAVILRALDSEHVVSDRRFTELRTSLLNQGALLRDIASKLDMTGHEFTMGIYNDMDVESPALGEGVTPEQLQMEFGFETSARGSGVRHGLGDADVSTVLGGSTLVALGPFSTSDRAILQTADTDPTEAEVEVEVEEPSSSQSQTSVDDLLVTPPESAVDFLPPVLIVKNPSSRTARGDDERPMELDIHHHSHSPPTISPTLLQSRRRTSGEDNASTQDQPSGTPEDPATPPASRNVALPDPSPNTRRVMMEDELEVKEELIDTPPLPLRGHREREETSDSSDPTWTPPAASSPVLSSSDRRLESTHRQKRAASPISPSCSKRQAVQLTPKSDSAKKKTSIKKKAKGETYFDRRLKSQIILRRSDGHKRGKGEWPTKGPNTRKGRLQEIICESCMGRCHWSCAGFDASTEPTNWACPDCRAARKAGESMERAPLLECIRYNCILRENRRYDDIEGDDDEYVVEKVLGRRAISRDEQGKRHFQYLIKWAGYPMDECTWDNLGGDMLIDAFIRDLRDEDDDADRSLCRRVTLLEAAMTHFDEKGERVR